MVLVVVVVAGTDYNLGKLRCLIYGRQQLPVESLMETLLQLVQKGAS